MLILHRIVSYRIPLTYKLDCVADPLSNSLCNLFCTEITFEGFKFVIINMNLM